MHACAPLFQRITAIRTSRLTPNRDIQLQINPTRKPAAEFMHAGAAVAAEPARLALTELRHHHEPEHRAENRMKIDARQMQRAGPRIAQQARNSDRTEGQRKRKAAGTRRARA